MARPRTNALPTPSRTPKTANDWTRLMMAVIERAEQIGSNHLPGLRHAQVNGQAEAHLRRFGIIHTGDIEREFPLP